MISLRVLAVVLGSSLIGGTLSAKKITVDPERMITIYGAIDSSVFQKSLQLLAFSPVTNEKKEPITILVNSPGGMVGPGLGFIDTMGQAKARGYRLDCVTAVYAASMAFQILAHCSNIYTLPHAKLLFHPPAVVTTQPLRAFDMAYLFGELMTLEKLLAEELISLFGFEREMFFNHFAPETLWEARVLAQHTRRITIVTDVLGIDKELLTTRNPSASFRQNNIRAKHGEFIYIAPNHPSL